MAGQAAHLQHATKCRLRLRGRKRPGRPFSRSAAYTNLRSEHWAVSNWQMSLQCYRRKGKLAPYPQKRLPCLFTPIPTCSSSFIRQSELCRSPQMRSAQYQYNRTTRQVISAKLMRRATALAVPIRRLS